MSHVAPPPSARYVPSLDGIRALAVVAVVLYHLDFHVADGGFLGVEVFFVLSGYLITTLLLRERRERRSIGLQAFWGRRARRLLPAVVAMIAVVCGISALFHATNVHVRDDAIASLLYVENWWAIIDQRAYFEQFGQPSPFTHLWSLAIEEQFYLLWPLALAGALRYLSKAKAFALTLVLAGLSVWAMVQLSDITHVERAYYGTDTRAFGLLLGAAMAFVWKPGDRLRRPGTGRARRILDLLSVLALGGLVWQLAGRSEFDAWTFPWGLLWVDLLSLVLVAAAVAPSTVVSRALGVRPLAAIGRRSYSLYLWHWPVIVLLRPGGGRPLDGWPTLVLCGLLMAALTEVSFRFVERPFRTGQLAPALPERFVAAWRSPRRVARGFAAASALVVAAVVAVALTGPSTTDDALTAPVSRSRPTVGTASPATATTLPSVTTTPPGTEPTPASVAPVTTAPPSTATTAPLVPTSTVPVSVIGESVTLAAEGELQQRFTTAMVNAAEGRQFGDTESAVEALAQQGALSTTVVVHVGNNGPIPAGGLDELLQVMDGRRLILLTVNVPRRWEAQVNDSIRAFVGANPGVTLIDWKAAVQADPGLVGSDGVHLTQSGISRYVDLIAGVVGPD